MMVYWIDCCWDNKKFFFYCLGKQKILLLSNRGNKNVAWQTRLCYCLATMMRLMLEKLNTMF